MARFPDVRALADATTDEVLHLWTGLGYYARARNLHRAAQLVRDEHGGEFPRVLEKVVELPGIGRSTAGRHPRHFDGARHAILDGNVKRVLARQHGVDGATDENATLAELWRLAEDITRRTKTSAVYTQAIMDLGATLCTRANPRCADCPIASGCRARIEGRQAELPAAQAPPCGAQTQARLHAGGAAGIRGVAGAASCQRHLGRVVVPAGIRRSGCRERPLPRVNWSEPAWRRQRCLTSSTASRTSTW